MEQRKSEVVHLRLPREAIQRLAKKAHDASKQNGRFTSRAEIVRQWLMSEAAK
jgi:hypothetical protein